MGLSNEIPSKPMESYDNLVGSVGNPIKSKDTYEHEWGCPMKYHQNQWNLIKILWDPWEIPSNPMRTL